MDRFPIFGSVPVLVLWNTLTLYFAINEKDLGQYGDGELTCYGVVWGIWRTLQYDRQIVPCRCPVPRTVTKYSSKVEPVPKSKRKLFNEKVQEVLWQIDSEDSTCYPP